MIASVLLISLINLQSVKEPQSKDYRLLPINQDALITLIRSTPLASQLHERIVVRARNCKLGAASLKEYTRIWAANPKNSRSNFLRGFAAMAYWEAAAFREGESPGSPKCNELMAVAKKCLASAVEIDPKSAPANREYGFLVWQYDGNMKKGFEILKQAELLDPKDPTIHARLGNVYSNPSSNVYDTKKAEIHLRTAIKLDPVYAAPHGLLCSMYQVLKKTPEAEREKAAMNSLIPEGIDPKYRILLY